MWNAISVDVEDYFHVEAFASRISPRDWDSFLPRVERNVKRILDLFARHETRGTFFILGWVTARFPQLVREIGWAGHEIGCHGLAHQHIKRQTPEQFRLDVREAKDRLTQEVQKPVRCYRAPSFSVMSETRWAIEILAEEGFEIDSSIFPVRHDLYGMPDAPRFPYWHQTSCGNQLFEFPPSTIRLGNTNIGVGGGGYFRLMPYCISRRALQSINETDRMPAMVYFHPWEIDPDQPRVDVKLRSRLRHYTNLATMEGKIERLLGDFQFTTVTEAAAQLDCYSKKIGVVSGTEATGNYPLINRLPETSSERLGTQFQ
jgi:polysaccharide deacetylase family protein (PEP-CTERM system associated)